MSIAGHIGVNAASPYSTNSSSSVSRNASPKGNSSDGNGNKPGPRDRPYYKHWLPIQTRWSDNDQYSHVNNAI